jgi:hypothetical protein
MHPVFVVFNVDIGEALILRLLVAERVACVDKHVIS